MTVTRRMFGSLRIRNYRLYFAGQLVSLCGTWMQSIAQGWLVLQLTGSGVALGLVTALTFLPMLIAGPWGGVIADRFDKRRTIMIAQAWMATTAAVLAAVTLTGVVELWMVYVLAFLFGCGTVVDMPTRQSFVSEMVGPEDLTNAIGLGVAMFNVARTIGPAIGGALILAVGTGVCFMLNAVSYVAVIAGLLLMRPHELFRHAPAPRARRQVRDAMVFAWRTPVLRSTLLLLAVVSTFGFNFPVMLPLLARVEFHGDAGTYAILSSVLGAGSLLGALLAAGRGRPTPALLVGAAAAFGLLLALASGAPTLVLAAGTLFVAGAAGMAFIATANATVQLNVEPAMRGRIMALFSTVMVGSTPVGGPIIGWISERWGPRVGLGIGGGIPLVAALAAAAVLLRARPSQADGVVADPTLVAA